MRRMYKKKMNYTGVLFLLPAVVFITMCNIIPFVWNFILSFQQWNGFNTAEFIGGSNYVAAIQDGVVIKSMQNSIVYALASTLGGVLLGLFLATLIFRMPSQEGGGYRLLLYSPAMLPTAVVGLMFTFFYNPKMGILNNFLELVGLESWTHVWLQDERTAMASIIFVAIWKCTGAVMILTFAAMQSIPYSLYESSRIDGAGFWRQMLYITYPLIKPMILLATINTLGTQFKSYDLIAVMTQGGPGNLTATVPIIMTKYAFNFGYFGKAAAMGVLFTIIVALCIIITRRMLRGESYEL